MGEPEVFDRLDPVVDPDPAQGLTRQDRDAAVRAVMATMPPRSQTLLNMLMADPPMPYEQVAADLGIPIGSIGPTRQRCLRVLRAKCVSAGIEPRAPRPPPTSTPVPTVSSIWPPRCFDGPAGSPPPGPSTRRRRSATDRCQVRPPSPVLAWRW
jgi:hypothetical protein